MRSTTFTKDEVEMLVEQKVLELLGDPDSGLQLKDGFKKKLRQRLKNLSDTVAHAEIVKKYAQS